MIRACKSKQPERRLEKIYRRCFYNGPMEHYDMAQLLVNICNEYFPMSTTKLLDEMNPKRREYIGCAADTPYYTVVMRILISHIRLSCVDGLPGWRDPAWVRNRAA